MVTENIFTFIAIWTEDLGSKVIEIYPKEEKFDFKTIAENIFITYHNLYKKEISGTAERRLFKLPLVNITKKASIFLDGIQDEEEDSKLIIVVIIFPDYFSDESVKIFDNILQNIGMEYIETKSLLLEKYFNQINEKYLIEQKVKDTEISIDDNYLLPEALKDYQEGLRQIQKKEFDNAYYLLRKAYLRFEIENELKMLLETTYFLGTVLMQKNKYEAAKGYFQKLQDLSQQLEHQKYLEKSLFMEGYCDYQGENYNNAYKCFMKLGKTELKFVSKFQYLMLLGKILGDVGFYDDAIKTLEKGLEISKAGEGNIEIKKKRGEIYLDLGHIYYEMVYQAIKSGKIEKDASRPHLIKSTESFKEAGKVYRVIKDYSGLIDVYQLIASNYEILGEMEEAIEHYEKALEFAKLSNDLANRFKILKKIIQNYEELNLHEKIIIKLDIILHEIAPIAYLDLVSVAGFHAQLGESFIKLNRNNDALSELIVALNLYLKSPNPVPELLNVYNKLIEIYEQKNDSKHVQYYKNKWIEFQEELEKREKQEKVKYKALEVIEEFWVFTDEGVALYTHTPKTNATPRLLSNFLIAMDNFGAELKLDQIKTIKIGLEYFAYYKEKGRSFFIVGRANAKFKVDIIEKIIKMIYLRFWIAYEPLLENFDGDTSKFDSFINELKDLDDII